VIENGIFFSKEVFTKYSQLKMMYFKPAEFDGIKNETVENIMSERQSGLRFLLQISGGREVARASQKALYPLWVKM
jgi:hypothetical protein